MFLRSLGRSNNSKTNNCSNKRTKKCHECSTEHCSSSDVCKGEIAVTDQKSELSEEAFQTITKKLKQKFGQTLTGQRYDAFRYLTLLSNGHTVTVSEDQTITVWGKNVNDKIFEIKNSHKEKIIGIVELSNSRFATYSTVIKIWSTNSYELICTLPAGEDDSSYIDFFIESTNLCNFISCSGATIKFWNNYNYKLERVNEEAFEILYSKFFFVYENKLFFEKNSYETIGVLNLVNLKFEQEFECPGNHQVKFSDNSLLFEKNGSIYQFFPKTGTYRVVTECCQKDIICLLYKIKCSVANFMQDKKDF